METELLSGGSSIAQTFVGMLLLVIGWLVRSAIVANTTEQKESTKAAGVLSKSLDSLKVATEAETRAIRAEVAIHGRRLDGHDEEFRRWGRGGQSGSAGSAP